MSPPKKTLPNRINITGVTSSASALLAWHKTCFLCVDHVPGLYNYSIVGAWSITLKVYIYVQYI
jgi:hypothetical protein